MNDEELRRRLDTLFVEYGGPIVPFMESVHAWAKSEDRICDLPDLSGSHDKDHYCESCNETLVCADCEGLVDEDEAVDCKICGRTLICPKCEPEMDCPTCYGDLTCNKCEKEAVA